MSSSLHKNDALVEIVNIAKRHGISTQDIISALSATGNNDSKTQEGASTLKRIFSYIGGILVLSGIGAFITLMWPDMGSFARVVITLGTGIVTFILALAASKDTRYERAATPLYLVAAALQPFGIFVMLDEYSTGGNPHIGVLFLCTYMIIQQGLTFYKTQATVLAFTTTVFAATFFGNLMDWMDIPYEWTGLTISIALLAVAQATNKSRHAAIAPFWFFISSVGLLCTVFDIVKNSALEILYLGLTGVLIYGSIAFRSRTLLLTSTLGMLWYIGYFTAKYFADSLGWPILLIILGLVFMAIGSLAVKINTQYIQKKG